MNNWKTIISFTQAYEAHIVKGYLESEGIETIIRDELTAQIYSNAIGGIRLDVRESDYATGISLLKKGGYIVDRNKKNTPKIEIIEFTNQTDENICPFCKSLNIDRKWQANGLKVFLHYIFGGILKDSKHNYICFDCKKEWNYKK